jgi:hypothetical protein
MTPIGSTSSNIRRAIDSSSTPEEFAAWQAAYEAVAPNPDDFFPFLERMQPVVHDLAGWTDDEIRSITAPTFLVIGDRDFVRLDHAAEMLDLFPDCRLAVLPATRTPRSCSALRRAPGCSSMGSVPPRGTRPGTDSGGILPALARRHRRLGHGSPP